MDISCKVYVGDLGKHVSYHKLKDAFSPYGRIKHVWVARNPPGVVACIAVMFLLSPGDKDVYLIIN